MGLASVSVIIPAYNAAVTIGDAIRSALQQHAGLVSEVIVVDDGSSDNTAEVVSQQFPQVRLMRVANGGPSRARNYGMRQAEGDWLAFLDADDRWHPDKLSVQLSIQSPGVELVACDWVRAQEFPSIPASIPVSQLEYRDLLTMNQFQTSTVMISRRLANELNGFDPTVDGAEDWDFWLRAALYTRVMKVDWPLVQYRDVATGYSKDVWRVYMTMQPMLDKHRGTDVMSPREFATLESWHHLRFWVAFRLAHDAVHARIAWRNAVQKRLRRRLPGAVVGYLLPFLFKRVRRSRSSKSRNRLGHA